MKKVISVFLAVLMMFSALTVGFMAFAEDAEVVAQEEKTNETVEKAFNYFFGMSSEEFMALSGNEQWEQIKNMDFDKLMILVRTAKVALKLIKFAAKIISFFENIGFIDLSNIKNVIVGFVLDAIINNVNVPAATLVLA